MNFNLALHVIIQALPALNFRALTANFCTFLCQVHSLPALQALTPCNPKMSVLWVGWMGPGDRTCLPFSTAGAKPWT
jgi:hypothetical protein